MGARHQESHRSYAECLLSLFAVQLAAILLSKLSTLSPITTHSHPTTSLS